MNDRTRTTLLAVVLAVAAGAVYSPALGVGFFSDDYQWLGRMNATLEHPSYVFTVFYRDFNPVLHASFALDWLAGAATPWVWHLDSVLLHAAAVVLLFLVCLRAGASRPVATAATLLWAFNVRLSEAVIWPAARGHQFAALCSLAAVLLMQGRLRGRRWLALAALTVGMFAKETTLFAVVAIPFLLPDWRKERRFLAALGGLAGAFVLLNVWLKDDLHTSGAAWSELLFKAPFILLRPLGLGDAYGFNLAGLALTALAFLAVLVWLRRGLGLAGLIWVLACSAPIVPLDKLSSRYLYLPAIGYSLLFCAACAALAPALRSDVLRRWVPAALALGVALVTLGNGLRIQREIGDYRLLAEPYGTLVERVAPALESIERGQTFLVVDTAAQTTIRDLVERIRERGNMTKLIPYRRHAIDGLIELPDLLNVARERSPGALGRAVMEADDSSIRWFQYDGVSLVEIAPRPIEKIPIARVHRAAWGE